MIIYPNNYLLSDVKNVFKWMFDPKNNTILISRNRNQHKYIHYEYKQNNNISDFNDCIRFVHLEEIDFKTKNKNRLFCVRPYNENMLSREQIIYFIKDLGINSEIIFDATNAKLWELTGNYKEKY